MKSFRFDPLSPADQIEQLTQEDLHALVMESIWRRVQRGERVFIVYDKDCHVSAYDKLEDAIWFAKLEAGADRRPLFVGELCVPPPIERTPPRQFSIWEFFKKGLR